MKTLLLSILLMLIAATVGAYPSLFDANCASCHSDDSDTCNGCHYHGGNFTADANSDSYAPGEALTVVLDGGSQSGWIRAILYDDNGVVQALAEGPNGTGDNGAGDPVVFPVDLGALAPGTDGDYAWEAAWFGGNDNGVGHTEERVAVNIHVEATATGGSTLSAIKSLY